MHVRDLAWKFSFPGEGRNCCLALGNRLRHANLTAMAEPHRSFASLPLKLAVKISEGQYRSDRLNECQFGMRSRRVSWLRE